VRKRSARQLAARAGDAVDSIVQVFAPRAALKRRAARFAYEALTSHRTRKKRTDLGGTADRHLGANELYKLREICRDVCRNNPLAVGLLETERDGVIGAGPQVQARTADEKLNAEIEAAWAEQMTGRPCDVTGRLNFQQFLAIQYLSYRRDGDCFCRFVDRRLEGVEGERVGTPWSGSSVATAKHYDIINGVAYSKQTGELIGYYIGLPDKWGYIRNSSYKKVAAESVHHTFNRRRYSQSRGEPALTPALNVLDTLCDYIDAELVAAKVNACFTMFISKEYPDMPDAYTGGVSSTGKTDEGIRHEKMEPGSVIYGGLGEKAIGIGQTRPGSLFDPFVQRMLTFVGRPLCIPLMLITLDFSGATYMNTRVAYQQVQRAWKREQDWVVKPLVSRVWRWWLQGALESKEIRVASQPLRDSILRHDVVCCRWPYVDPFKEAQAHKLLLENRTTSRRRICAGYGEDHAEIAAELEAEEKDLKARGLAAQAEPKQRKGQENAGDVQAD
jgi:lambda family phage portal protein